MTAEVAIMNKRAVAIAADSAVTITTEKGKKIFTSVNKIFKLSKHHPVGIMVFGSAEFMGVPWETIVKLYQNYLENKSYKRLSQYFDDFVNFLIKKNKLFLPAMYAERRMSSYFRWQILQSIEGELKKIFEKKKKVSMVDYRKIVSQIIERHHEIWSKAPFGHNISEEDLESLRRKHEKIIRKIKREVFAKITLTRDSSRKLSDIAIYLSVKFPVEITSRNISGVVIVGFGDGDVFPSLCSAEVECIVDNILKYENYKETKISRRNSASIMAFAQRDMVVTFMEGVNPVYMGKIEGDLSEILSKFPEIIIDSLTQLNSADKKRAKEKIKKISRKEFTKYREKLKTLRYNTFVNPVVEAVTVLPKDELAMLAESLINLTSLKRKVSMGEEETVGGPVDVAVISKEDGFVWAIKKESLGNKANF